MGPIKVGPAWEGSRCWELRENIFLFTQEAEEASKTGNEDKVPRSLHLVMHVLREDRTS